MKPFKLIVSSLLCFVLVYFLDNGWNIGGTPIPPLGKFLDPFHGFWQNIESEKYPPSTTMNSDGLFDSVTVVYDSLLIPHIFAQNDGDLYWAQGYVTAMHRLWQMEFQTHAAAGRVSEIIPGQAILNYDRRQRRLGMVYGARQALQAMQSDSIVRQIVERYSQGVNSYINSLRYKDLPFEYKLLDYEPEPWEPLKSALLLMNMSQTLNLGDKDIEMTNALHIFGKDVVALLYPDDERVGDPIVDRPGEWKFDPVKFDSVAPALPVELISIDKGPAPDPMVGSNNWAVAGVKTKTGAPILCNDPHLQLTLPSLWYAIQLKAPGANTMGVSLPGSPCIIIGFNDSIAWGLTNAQRDLVDWYRIEYKDERRNEYLLDGKWKNIERAIETIKIKGKAPFYDTVTYTHWGPVPYDKNYRASHNLRDYAFRWIAHEPSNEVTALYRLNRANNHDDYMEALNEFSKPAQNFVFASVGGDIAIRVQGKFPVRRQHEGKFVLDGSKTSSGWQAYIPNEHNIAVKNPIRGFVSSANQYPVDSSYPYYITSTIYDAYRNRRINNVLREANNISVEDMMKLQNDNYNLKAFESLPLFLRYIDSTSLQGEAKVVYDRLKDWNFYNEAGSEAAVYYEAWWDELMPLIWDEMFSDTLELAYPTAYRTIQFIREQPDLSFFDIVATREQERAGDVVAKAFFSGVARIEKWKKEHEGQPLIWANYKDSFVGHLLPPMKALSIPVKTGGNNDIINAHSTTHGPSWRMVVSLEKIGVKAWATYPGGQSGNPGSYFYNNLLSRWVDGKYYPLSFYQSPQTDSPETYIFNLNPSK